MFSKNGLQGVRTVAATGVMIAGLTLGLCRGASAQAAGTAAAEGSSLTAQQKADAARERAEELRQAGGWAYKTGAVARAEREAQLAAPQLAAEPVPPSPARAAALARLEELRRAGGWAYKTGAVARAAAEAEALAVAPQQTAVCRPEEVGALSSPTTSSAI
jgi:hypothetical protein